MRRFRKALKGVVRALRWTAVQLAKVLRSVWGWIIKHPVAFFTIVAFALMFTIFRAIAAEVKPDTSWVVVVLKKHGSDILMALVVAFLATVILVAEMLRYKLNEHINEVKNNRNELTKLEGRLNTVRTDLQRASQSIMQTTGVHRTLSDILYKGARAGYSMEAVAVLDGTEKLAGKWFDFVCPHDKQVSDSLTESLRRLESLCWFTAFEEYVKEELSDLEGERDLHSVRVPILATNYPTYLELLRKLSRKLSLATVPEGFLLCYFAVANTYPVEWVMLCERDGENLFCRQDKDLDGWCSWCHNIAHTPNTVCRRVFLTVKDGDLSPKYNVPSTQKFNKQMEQHVWKDARGGEPQGALPMETWNAIRKQLSLERMSAYIHIKGDSSGFYLSRTASKNTTHCTIEGTTFHLESQLLQDILVSHLHAAPFSLTARRTEIDADLELEATKESARSLADLPTDLLIVGLISKDEDLHVKCITEKIRPLIALECQFRDPRTNASILALYSASKAESHLKKWCMLLEDKAEALQ